MTPRRTICKVPANRASHNENSNRDAEDTDDDDFVNPLQEKQSGAQGNKEANANVGTSKRNTPKVVCKRGRPQKKKARIEEADAVVEVKGKTYCTVRCSPNSIATIVKGMTEGMKKRVQHIGFGEILKFAFDAIGDRDLAMFLMDRIKLDPLRIVIGEKVLPLDANVVHGVLGLPIGGDPLPILSSSDRSTYQSELRTMCDNKGMKDLHTARQKKFPKMKKYEALKPHEVPRWVVEEFASRKNDDDWTLRCFLMTLFNALLFPTSNLDVLGHEYFYCLDLDKVGKFDWCNAVIDDFTEKVAKWHSGSKCATPAVQGCIVVPLIYYLDNIYLPPHSLTDLTSQPRAAFFHGSMVDLIEKGDRKFSTDGKTKTYGKLPLRDKAMTCYEKIRATANTPGPIYQAFAGEHQSDFGVHISRKGCIRNDGDKHQSDGDKQPFRPQEPHFSADSLHLYPLFSDLYDQLSDKDQREQIILAIQRHDKVMDGAMANVQRAEMLISESKTMMKEAQLNLVSEVNRIICPSVQHVDTRSERRSKRLHDDISTPCASSRPSEEQSAHATHDSSLHRSQEQAEQGNASETLHEKAEQGNISETLEVAMPAEKDGSIFLSETAAPTEHICQGNVSKVAEGPMPVNKDGSTISPKTAPHHELIGQGNISKTATGPTSLDKDSTILPETESHLALDNSLGGVHDKSFNWDAWADVSSVLRDIQETQSFVDEGNINEAEAGEPRDNVEMPIFEDEATVVEQNPRDNDETVEQYQRPAMTYKRKNKGKKKNKELPLLFQIPIELGLPVVEFQLAPHATTRGNKFASPFKAPMIRREPPDVDNSAKLRDIIVCGATTKKLENLLIFKTKPEYQSQDIDCCITFASRVAESFADHMTIHPIFIHFFSLCLLNDEKEVRPTSAGYRLILPGTLSDTVLYEQYNTGSQYSIDAALSFFLDRYKADDLLDAKLIFFPVLHNNHWTIYCVNLVHGQIDILDPYPWETNKEQMEYHGSFAARIRGRLHELLQSVTDGQFLDISYWSLPFVEVPKQLHKDDSGVFAMMFLEHYDGEKRKMDITIDPELVSQYRAQLVHYMVFHKINSARPFPDEIEALAPCRLESVHMASLDEASSHNL